MRARLAILIALVATAVTLPLAASPVHASEPSLAQETETGEDQTDTETGGTDTQGGDEDEAEGGGEEQGASGEETGPPWTYQMARIALGLLALTIVGVAFAYYRFVFIRRREGF